MSALAAGTPYLGGVTLDPSGRKDLSVTELK